MLLTAILAVQVSIDCLSYCRFEVSLVLVWCRQTPVEPASVLFDPCNALSDVCRLSHGQVVVSGVQQCSVVYEVAFVLVFVMLYYFVEFFSSCSSFQISHLTSHVSHMSHMSTSVCVFW